MGDNIILTVTAMARIRKTNPTEKKILNLRVFKAGLMTDLKTKIKSHIHEVYISHRMVEILLTDMI